MKDQDEELIAIVKWLEYILHKPEVKDLSPEHPRGSSFDTDEMRLVLNKYLPENVTEGLLFLIDPNNFTLGQYSLTDKAKGIIMKAGAIDFLPIVEEPHEKIL